MSLVERAELFAIAAHSAVGQTRKYTGEPYWHHPRAVAGIVASVTDDPEMIAAAWLHDVVEDTQVEHVTIWTLFGARVGDLVIHLTDISKPEDGNRAMRKEVDRAHISIGPPEAKTIKLADLIDNTSSIVARDPGFAKVYLAEKAKLLEVLRDGDPVLWNRAEKMLVDGLREIAA